MMRAEKEISCEALLNSSACFLTWILAHCRNLLRYSDVGTGLGFGIRYLLAKSMGCRSDLDQFRHSVCLVLHLALPPVCAPDLHSSHWRGHGNKWGNIGNCHGCLLPSPCNRCSTRFGAECRCNVSDALPAPIHVDKPRSKPDRHSCDASDPLSRTQEIGACTNIAACFGD